jgi:hypothetical protein
VVEGDPGLGGRRWVVDTSAARLEVNAEERVK